LKHDSGRVLPVLITRSPLWADSIRVADSTRERRECLPLAQISRPTAATPPLHFRQVALNRDIRTATGRNDLINEGKAQQDKAEAQRDAAGLTGAIAVLMWAN
jgi:hypothetical protein